MKHARICSEFTVRGQLFGPTGEHVWVKHPEFGWVDMKDGVPVTAITIAKKIALKLDSIASEAADDHLGLEEVEEDQTQELLRKAEVWKRFKAGGVLSDAELDELIADCQETERLLTPKPELGCAKTTTVFDLCALQAIRRARLETGTTVPVDMDVLCERA